MTHRTIITNLEPRRTIVYAKDRKTVVYARAGMGPVGPPGAYPIPMSIRGTLAAGFGQIPYPITRDAMIVDVIMAAGTAPVGASVIVDIKKNGVTLFPVTLKPEISSGDTLSVPVVPDVIDLTEGDVLTVDVVQVGSIIPGANATIVIEVV